MLTKLRLDNFRGFVTTDDLTFGKINLFYGPNSGGKSTILRSLSLLKQSFAYNDVDQMCVLLPYSRDGIDMGSPTTLHHNLDRTVPFSISFTYRGREPFRIARPKRFSIDSESQAPVAGSSTRDVAAPAHPPSTSDSGSWTLHKIQWQQRQQTEEDVFFDHPAPDWTVSLTIADGGLDVMPILHKVHFGNQHFMVYGRRVPLTKSRARSDFADTLRNVCAHLSDAGELELLHAASDTAMRRRSRRHIAISGRRAIASLNDEFQESGCFAVDDVVFGSEYESALARYLVDAAEDIAGFSSAVARDLVKLQQGFGLIPNKGPLASGFADTLQKYFLEVARAFSDSPTESTCLAWWKADLKRCRFVTFGYSNLDYVGDDIPPLAHWMMTAWWAEWAATKSQPWKKGTDLQSRLATLERKLANSSILYGLNDRMVTIDDVASIYYSATELAGRSLSAVRDIGPDRVSAERVYRVEPRHHTATDYVGRRATEIPRVLYESPQLLQELNLWLKRVEIPYRLIVDPLEIRGGGGTALRQTGLFELNAELSHTENARINLCDVGHGLFKQLALPIQVFLCRNRIITIEEPETNVHPRLQAEIADLFIDAALNRGHQIFAEAHSEILSLRLRRRIGEGRISHEDVRIFYVHAPDSGPCVVLPLALDRHGNLLNEPPGGFFDEWLNEV